MQLGGAPSTDADGCRRPHRTGSASMETGPSSFATGPADWFLSSCASLRNHPSGGTVMVWRVAAYVHGIQAAGFALISTG